MIRMRACALPCLVSVLALTSACTDVEKKSDLLPPRGDFEGFTDDYLIADPRCQGESGAVDLESGTIWTWLAGRGPAPDKASFTGFRTAESLTSPATERSLHGLEYTQSCTQGASGRTCSADVQVNSVPRDFRICQQTSDFARTSVEAVTLTSKHTVNAAWAWYRGLTGHRPEVARPNLLILPRAETRTRSADGRLETQEVMTDNLAYTPDYLERPTLIVFPKGKSLAKLGIWTGINLWEIPYGMAHELGHHIMQTHVGRPSGGTSLASGDAAPGSGVVLSDVRRTLHDIVPPPIVVFDHRTKQPAEDSSLKPELLRRSVGVTENYSAINEAFSDLFAWYSLGSPPRMLAGVDCFSETREADSPTFFGGRPKVLDAPTLAIWQSTVVRPPAAEPCKGPNLQGVHDFGAIVAHGLARLFQERVGGDSAERGRLLLLWAANMKTFIDSANPADVTVSALASEGIAAASRDGVLSGAQCAIVREVFPVIAAQVLPQTSGDGAARRFSCE